MPILIARRVTPLTPEERVAFTHGANTSSGLRMNAAEQAAADARLIRPDGLARSRTARRSTRLKTEPSSDRAYPNCLHRSAAACWTRGEPLPSRGTAVAGSDIVLPPRWKLLGPFEAVSGMLMFGLTTAFIFADIRRLIHARFDGEDNFLL
jgi:hypothetical protein